MSKKSSLFGIFLALLLVIAGIYSFIGRPDAPPAPSTPASAEIHFLDVGQGDAALICSDAGNILIDAGPRSAANVVAAYLTKQNIKTIDCMILTHPHEDHIGGVPAVFGQVEVKRVIMPNAVSASSIFSQTLEAIEKSGAEVCSAVSGDTYQVGNMGILLLAPNDDTYDGMNNYSVVAKITVGETSFLFTGDAETLSEGEILQTYSPSQLHATVLKVGHHGSSTSTSDDFLAAVSPTAAVISCGEGNSYGHPSTDILKKLKHGGITVYRTDKLGAIVLKTDGHTVWKE